MHGTTRVMPVCLRPSPQWGVVRLEPLCGGKVGVMSKLELALTLDGTNAWFGYEKGVGHMIMSSVITPGGDHIGGNSETVEIVCASGKTLETARMVEKFIGDAKCKRCIKWLESDGFKDTIASALEAAAAQENGPSVADMIMSDPDAVIITLDSALAEEKAESKEKADKGKKTAKKGKGKKTAPVDAGGDDTPVKCGPNSAALDNGDGSGVCRACSWHGPMKVVETDKGETTVMTAHYVGGRAPKSVTLDERKVGSDAPAAPATVDTAHKGADDMISGDAAGMLPGRTSLTRGSDMTGATPRERKNGPVRTTNDTPLGRERTDKSAKIEIAGGQYGYLTPAEVGKLSRTESRRYWRHVKRNRDRAATARKMIKARATDTRTRAERMSG